MREAILRNLPAKTGRTVEQWADALLAERLATRKDQVEWLRRKHGLGPVQAATVADYALAEEGSEERPAAELVEAQYAGEKKALRRLYERLREELEALGADVQVEPRRTYVAFTRGREFALLQPSTKDRIDVGLALPNLREAKRLRPAGSFGSDRITHRVGLKSEDGIDEDLRAWMLQAYVEAER